MRLSTDFLNSILQISLNRPTILYMPVKINSKFTNFSSTHFLSSPISKRQSIESLVFNLFITFDSVEISLSPNAKVTNFLESHMIY